MIAFLPSTGAATPWSCQASFATNKLFSNALPQHKTVWALKRDLRQAAALLRTDMQNRNAALLFEKSGRDLMALNYDHVAFVGRLYQKALGGRPPTPENLQILVRSLQYHTLLTHMNGWPVHGVMKIIKRLLISGVQNSSISVREALDTIAWLESQNLRFFKAPSTPVLRGLWNSYVWILGDLHRVARAKVGGTDLVEQAIVEQFNSISRFAVKTMFIGNFKKSQRLYKFSDAFVQKMEGLFRDWLVSSESFPVSQLDRSQTVGPMTIDEILLRAKRVVSIPDFIQEQLQQPTSGYLLGMNGYLYDAILDVSYLTHFRWAFNKNLMSVQMPEKSIDQKYKVAEFMRKLLKSREPIFFMLPSSINKTTFTRMELEYLVKNPESLSQITFLIGQGE